MEKSHGWKSFLSIASSTVSPLLHSQPLSLGPLIFNPNPYSLTTLFSSTSLLPPLHLPPYLEPSRFLLSSEPTCILPSTASSVSSLFSPRLPNDAASYFTHNRIHLLNNPNSPNVVVFFPTGDNDENVGFFMLSVKGSQLQVQLDTNGDVFSACTGFKHRILRIVLNPVAEFGSMTGNNHVIGYLMASSFYSVHWFCVNPNSILERPSVCYLGHKVFKTCPVVHACWSPHILEQSLVLLESGQMFLFDLESHSKGMSLKGTRLEVSWDDFGISRDTVWLTCEFSWHPRILIVARSDAIFLVDFRLKECNVSRLMKIETLRMYSPNENERFLALSRAGPDNFYFAVSTSSLLLLCDVRKPMMPVLQWAHGMDRPCYINVVSLSMLRSHSREDTFKLASESGLCIILGSFWNCEFNTFFYGSMLPFQKGSIASKLSKMDTTFCAWELPSEINLSSHECRCGTCLLREELSKDALPEWVDWQLKKEIALGFGILRDDLASLLGESNKHGGFTLIRLMSSGKFESQRYYASWAPARSLDGCHEQELYLDRHLLYPMSDEKYKFPKKFCHIKLDYLHAYASGNLTPFLTRKLNKICIDHSFSEEVHEFLCEKLNNCGFGRLRSSPAITAVFEDVKQPSSFHEVALRRLWADLPLELLQFAFLKFSDCQGVVIEQNKVALEFLAVPDLPQLPPFFLRKSSPHSNDDIMGPVIPFPVLLVLNEFHNGCTDFKKDEFSVEAELGLLHEEVSRVAGDISASAYGTMQLDNHAVSLADDGVENWDGSSEPKSFVTYRPVAFNCSTTDSVEGNSIYCDKNHDTFIFHVPGKKSSDQTESIGHEIFDELCPIELRFDAPAKKFDPLGSKAYNLLKRQMSKWQQSFDSYKEFYDNSGFEKFSQATF